MASANSYVANSYYLNVDYNFSDLGDFSRIDLDVRLPNGQSIWNGTSSFTSQKIGTLELSSSVWGLGVTSWDPNVSYTVILKPYSYFNGILTTAVSHTPIPTYSLSATQTSIFEGGVAEFFVDTSNVPVGTVLNYQVYGVDKLDLAYQYITGSVAVDSDGNATIKIPTVIDQLIEGNEVLTVSLNGSVASTVLKDNVEVSDLLLRSSGISLYKTVWNAYVVGAGYLNSGDVPDDYAVLKKSNYGEFVPNGVTAIVFEDETTFGLISKKIVSGKEKYSEQLFSTYGVAIGKPVKITFAQVLEKEFEKQVDINGDNWCGDVISTVLDVHCKNETQDYSLYKTVSGRVLISLAGLVEGDNFESSITLLKPSAKLWIVPKFSTVEGMALTGSGDFEILMFKGAQLVEQKFDSNSGLMTGKPIVLKEDQLDVREYHYNLDLTGDGVISLVGQAEIPLGW